MGSPGSLVPHYTVAWEVKRFQDQLLRALAISPDGTRMVVSTEDCTLLLVDFSNGAVTGILCFEDQFFVLSTVWYSRQNLIIGCSNGSTYDVCFDPADKDSLITMCPILSPVPHQIQSLAYSPGNDLLAVGYGNTVALFTRGTEKTSEWNQVEVIKGPYNDRGGLVNALTFFPGPHGRQRLFIGYAEAGWSVWIDRGVLIRTDSSNSHNICRIGSVALSTDKRQIAISTLDRSIAIYPMSEEGPIASLMKEVHYHDPGSFSPIVPVALTANGLTLVGTTVGDVPMIETDRAERQEISLMRHVERPHVIRAIAAHNDRIVIGSSGWEDTVVKCYTPSVVLSRPMDVETTETPFRVTLTQALLGWVPLDGEKALSESEMKVIKRIYRLKRSAFFCLLGTLFINILVLSAEPPTGASFDRSTKVSFNTELFKPKLKRHEYWVLFGVRHFSRYYAFQWLAWLGWAFETAYSCLAEVGMVVPRTANIMLLGLGKWACERVVVYRENGICPKLDY